MFAHTVAVYQTIKFKLCNSSVFKYMNVKKYVNIMSDKLTNMSRQWPRRVDKSRVTIRPGFPGHVLFSGSCSASGRSFMNVGFVRISLKYQH